MLADYLLRNGDAHIGQFAVDLRGNIVGFDKGKANLFDKNERAWIRPYSILTFIFSDRIIYGSFLEYLTQNQEELNEILASDRVTEGFGRIDKLASSLETRFNDRDFDSMIPEKIDIQCFRTFYRSYIERFENVEREFRDYFIVVL